MSKVMMAAFLATCLVFSCLSCNKINSPEPLVVSPDSSLGVTISFGGLMVFHKENGRPSYEVGILGPDVSPEHEFTVSIDGVKKDRQHLPAGGSWSLEITNPQGTSGAGPIEVGHTARRPDSASGQYDFSWIIDLESSEFHGKELELKPGLLKPIFHLPNGMLFTEYKSIDLQRRQGNGSPSLFGFVPETIALHLELRKGQELVLKDNSSSGSNGEVFRLPYSPSHPPYYVSIRNVRNTPTNASDFGLYYKLFPGVPGDQQYDFGPTGSKLTPLNPYPMSYLMTCCGLLCTSMLLGKRTAPLQ
jgi:hypothetical protein